MIQTVSFSIRPAATYEGLELGIPPALLGSLSAAYAVAPLLLALSVGRAVDRLGERIVLTCGGALLLLTCLVMLLGPSGFGWLVASLALLGVAHLMSVVGEQTAVAHLGEGRTDAAFGRYTFASSAGQMLGPLAISIAGGSQSRPDIGPVLILGTVLAAAATVLSLFIKGGPRLPEVNRSRGTGFGLLRDARLRGAVITSGVVMASVDITLVFLPALGDERNLPAALVGTALAVRAAASMTVRLTVWRLVAWLGRGVTIAAGMTLAAAGLVAIAAIDSPTALMLGAGAVGAGLGVCQPLTMSLVADLAPPGRRGVAMTLRIFGNRLGLVIIPSAVGVAATGAGAPAVLVSTGLLLGVATLLARRST
ncbi:MFS transporter [Ornithinimicrobium ciconiae]|uniref:MFS transporter n=1 Tax=Ornithinimicrobium ciconiae TaxID=2594265 RepID=A0A516GE86_9MICO|nr:MFS transporter [Ornithinimicrobium ciconiae]QDO89821.1 MFS transporter [Ornithinimicrobium ciconiae]